ncbi:uridine phosphorylase [Streptococcus rupicaprae]|uniref:Uridine phosphorylase n=1 Tax=Streptococcus rupicaprae TaxID=759619 RepID=A0ABV2FKQ2_9STRE
MILEEFEPGPAVIEPHFDFEENTAIEEVCATIIMPFSGSLFESVQQMKGVRYGGFKSNINGQQPWYIYERDGIKVAVMLAQLGAPALIGTLEELQAIGFKQFILFGTCGVLDGNLETNKLIVPTSSIRDEGISYHYAPASDEIGYPADHLARFGEMLDKHGIPYTMTKAWTTDAFFRETPAKVKRRKEAGATVVDMEWASVAAWAQFRQKEAYHFFYTSDYVDPEGGWDMREGHDEENLLGFFEIALTLAKELEKQKS